MLKSQRALFVAPGFRPRRFLEGFPNCRRARGPLAAFAFHQLSQRAELEARILLFVGLVLVKAGAGGFIGFGGFADDADQETLGKCVPLAYCFRRLTGNSARQLI